MACGTNWRGTSVKICILNYEPERRGGGWTQARYLYEGLDCVSYAEAETVLVTGPTMASHGDVEQAKKDGKKIVLRCDNAVRDSRNRGTGMSRMKAFCELVDLVIYQSEWAKDFLMPFTKKDGVVILNGVDIHRFKPVDNRPDDSYLYVRSSRDEGKQWVNAWYWFVNNKGHLDIVGRFSPENIKYNFDFYNGERFKYWGEMDDIAPLYRRNRYFLYPYVNDACSNTLAESLWSGCEVIDVYGMLSTGGAPEIMKAWETDKQILTTEYMCREYSNAISDLL